MSTEGLRFYGVAPLWNQENGWSVFAVGGENVTHCYGDFFLGAESLAKIMFEEDLSQLKSKKFIGRILSQEEELLLTALGFHGLESEQEEILASAQVYLLRETEDNRYTGARKFSSLLLKEELTSIIFYCVQESKFPVYVECGKSGFFVTKSSMTGMLDFRWSHEGRFYSIPQKEFEKQLQKFLNEAIPRIERFGRIEIIPNLDDAPLTGYRIRTARKMEMEDRPQNPERIKPHKKQRKND
jgi:hypothetical protein